MNRAIVLFALVLCGGCRSATSVLVSVSSDRLTVPTDVASVRIIATNPDSTTPIYESADVPLCGGAVTSGCTPFPITVALRPGDRQPDALVRVEVTAFDAGGGIVTQDAALFTFTPGESRRLDFVLSPRCLRTVCAAQDRACGPAGGCVGIGTSTTETTPDLAPSKIPTGAVSRVYESDLTIGSSTPIQLAPPASAVAGDLVFLLTTHVVPPPGWTYLSPLGATRDLYVRRAEDAEPSSAYVFTAISPNAGASTFLLLVYRGVDRYIVGFASGEIGYDFPSFDVTVPGTVGFQIIAANGGIHCNPASDPTVFASTQSGNFAEWGPLPVGATGTRTISCTTDTYGAALIWLTPR